MGCVLLKINITNETIFQNRVERFVRHKYYKNCRHFNKIHLRSTHTWPKTDSIHETNSSAHFSQILHQPIRNPTRAAFIYVLSRPHHRLMSFAHWPKIAKMMICLHTHTPNGAKGHSLALFLQPALRKQLTRIKTPPTRYVQLNPF